MRFTIIFTLLCIGASFGAEIKSSDESKGKREAPLGYQSSHSYQSAPVGHEQSAVSVGAGYSIGGKKLGNSYTPISTANYQFPAENHQFGGHSTIQLAPITLQPSHGALVGTDLSQLMSQLSHSINSGGYALQSPATNQGYFGGQALSAHGGQELALPQFTYASPKLQQYVVAEQAYGGAHSSYPLATKGLGAFSSTGPVLFNPSESHNAQQTLNLGGHGSIPSFDAGAYSLGDSGHTFGSPALGSASHSLGAGGYSLGASEQSLGTGGQFLGAGGHLSSSGGHSYGGHSLGSSGNQFGASHKGLSGGYTSPSKSTFKPSTFLGNSVDSTHGLSSLSSSYAPSFGSNSHSGNFGGSLSGSSPSSHKFPSFSPYTPSKSEDFGSYAAFSSNGHLASPHLSAYNLPSASYSAGQTTDHAASSHSPQYYVSSKYPSGNFGEGSFAFKGAGHGHSSLGSFSSGPKYSFGGHGGPSSRYNAKDTQGDYSENTYNTIKYSEELKPSIH